MNIKNTGPAASVACHRGLWMMQIDNWPWSHTCWGHMDFIGPQVCKWVKFDIFGLSYKLISRTWPLLWPLTSWSCEGSYIISTNQVWFQSSWILHSKPILTLWELEATIVTSMSSIHVTEFITSPESHHQLNSRGCKSIMPRF